MATAKRALAQEVTGEPKYNDDAEYEKRKSPNRFICWLKAFSFGVKKTILRLFSHTPPNVPPPGTGSGTGSGSDDGDGDGTGPDKKKN